MKRTVYQVWVPDPADPEMDATYEFGTVRAISQTYSELEFLPLRGTELRREYNGSYGYPPNPAKGAYNNLGDAILPDNYIESGVQTFMPVRYPLPAPIKLIYDTRDTQG